MVTNKEHILQQIKRSMAASDPRATVILYGSYARGDEHAGSDIDLLVLLDKDKVTHDDQDRITHILYAIELDSGTIISPLIYSKNGWATHKVTPFYENVIREGRRL